MLLSEGFDKSDLIEYLSGKHCSSSDLSNNGVIVRLQNLANGTERDTLFADLVALSRHILCELLPFLLQRSANVQFGMSHMHQDHYSAIPYVSSNTPREGSCFGSPYETFCFTLQYLRSNALSTSHCRALLCEMQHKVEADAELSMGLANTLVEDFSRTCGVRLLHLNPSSAHDVQEFQVAINQCEPFANSSNTPLDAFLELLVMPQVKEYETRICSNSQNLVSSFRSVQGFSGTPAWNCETYSESLTTQLDTGTDGQTIDHMLAIESSVRTVENNLDPSTLLETMLNHGSYNAIIDVGAFFKGVTNEEVATILTRLFNESSHPISAHIRKVLYFNSNDELCALSVDGRQDLIGTTHNKQILEQTGCAPHQLFTYYDQRHTTGTDIQQASNARAIVTLDESTYLRDLLQGVMRLRLLGANQTVDYVITNTLLAPNKVADQVSVQDLLHRVVLVQSIQQADNNMCAVLHKFDNLLRAQVLAAIQEKHNDCELVMQFASQFRHALVDSSTKGPFYKFHMPSRDCGADVMIKAQQHGFVAQLPQNHQREMEVAEAVQHRSILQLGFLSELDSTKLLESLLGNVQERFAESVNGSLHRSGVLDVQEQAEVQAEMQVEAQMQHDEMFERYRGERPVLTPLKEWWTAGSKLECARWELISANCRGLQRLQSAANNADLGGLKRIAFDDYVFISNRLQSCVLHQSALLSPFQKVCSLNLLCFANSVSNLALMLFSMIAKLACSVWLEKNT